MAYSGQGSGTEQDPYLITTIKQFYETIDIFGEMNVSLYCKLTNDLDFNDDQDSWDLQSQNFNFKTQATSTTVGYTLDGNNHGLFNLYVFNKDGVFYSDAYVSLHFKNIILEAVVIYSQSDTSLFETTSMNSRRKMTFDNCDFRIKLYAHDTTPTGILFYRYSVFTNCIFNIDIICNDNAWWGNGQTNRALILKQDSSGIENFYNEWKINIIYIGTHDVSDKRINLFDSTAKHYFSSFFININYTKARGGSVYFYSSSGGSSYFYNSYIVAKNLNNTYKGTIVFNGAVYGVDFYDDQSINPNNYNSSGILIDPPPENPDAYWEDGNIGTYGTLLKLNTAQCKNATFLEQQGFIIAT